MPAKPLTDEQKADADRLRERFTLFQAGLRKLGLPSSQGALAEQLGIEQSAISQYINGGIPLNPAALISFCGVMEVDPAEISREIAASTDEWVIRWLARSSNARRLVGALPVMPKHAPSAQALEVAALCDTLLDSADRDHLVKVVTTFVNGPSLRRDNAAGGGQPSDPPRPKQQATQ